MENIQSETGEHEKSFQEGPFEDFGKERIETVIQNEHRRVEKKLSIVINDEELSVNERRNLYNEVKHEILHHMLGEEHSYYPAIDKTQGVRHGQIKESEQEHHQMRVLMNELDDIAVEDENWPAKLRVLCEDLKHHHREEEEEFLARTREAWSDQKAKEIGAEFLKAKMQANL